MTPAKQRVEVISFGNDAMGHSATWQQVRATSALPPQSRHALTRLARQFRATERNRSRDRGAPRLGRATGLV